MRRVEDEESGRWENEEDGESGRCGESKRRGAEDGESRRISISLLSLLPSPFFLLPSN